MKLTTEQKIRRDIEKVIAKYSTDVKTIRTLYEILEGQSHIVLADWIKLDREVLTRQGNSVWNSKDDNELDQVQGSSTRRT